MHEMGEMKRAQELRADDTSVQKFRENYETIQRLTSHMQEMQEQMNHGRRLSYRSQSAYNDSKFSFHAEPRQTLAS